MITDTLLNLLTSIFTPILNLIPTMDNLVIPDNICSYIVGVFRSIGVFIPVAELMPLLIFSIALTSWRLGFSLINRVRSLFI